MTLIDRYTAEVARRLPRRQRADISRELKSSLLDALESRFGPNASEEEAAVILREFGPPETVASSYWPAGQYLIGPQWFPAFGLVVRIHLTILAVVLAAGLAFQVLLPPLTADVGKAIGSFLGSFVQVSLFMVGAIVVVFHLLERGGIQVQWPRKAWNPHELPEVAESDLVGRGEALTAIAATAVGLVLLYQFKDSIGIPVDGKLLLNGVVRDNLSWVSLAAVLTIAQYALLLWSGRWHWYSRLSKLAVDLVGLYAVYRIAGDVISERATLIQAGFPEDLANGIMHVASAAPFVVAAIIIGESVWTLYRGCWAPATNLVRR